MKQRKINWESLIFTVLTVFMIMMLLTACADPKIVTEYIQPEPIRLYHPSLPTPAPIPAVKVKVITIENIKPNQAYVGFEYDDWLLFAGWLKADQIVKKKLKVVIEKYREQDKTGKDNGLQSKRSGSRSDGSLH